MFVIATLHENCCHEAYRIVGQWLYDHAVKLARWQHLKWGAERDLLCLATFVNDRFILSSLQTHFVLLGHV